MSPPSHLLERLLVPIAIGVGAACAPDSPDFDAESDASAGAGGSAGVDGGDAGLDSGGNGGAGGASGSSGSWGRKLGGPGAARVTDIELDAAGAVYLTGYFDQSIDLGSGNQASTGDEDAFLASYDPDGELAWPPRVIGSTKQDRGWEVEVDEAGNLLAAGEFQLSVNFGAETLTAVTTGTVDTKDAWLAVYSASSGASLGAQHVGTGPCHAEANGLAHGATETVVTVTYSDCSGMVVGRDNVSSSGLFDFALVDVSAGLALGPPQSVGTSNSEHASHITIGPGGDRFVAGYYRGAADYGKGPLPDTGATGQHHNALVMRLTREGTVVWAQGFASIDADDFSSVVVVGDVVYAAGHAGGVVPLADGGPSAYAGGFDGLLVALDAATGAVRWVKLLSGGGNDVLTVTTDGNQAIYVGGASAGASFDGLPVAVPAGSRALIYGRLMSDGQLLDRSTLEVTGPVSDVRAHAAPDRLVIGGTFTGVFRAPTGDLSAGPEGDGFVLSIAEPW